MNFESLGMSYYGSSRFNYDSFIISPGVFYVCWHEIEEYDLCRLLEDDPLKIILICPSGNYTIWFESPSDWKFHGNLLGIFVLEWCGLTSTRRLSSFGDEQRAWILSWVFTNL